MEMEKLYTAQENAEQAGVGELPVANNAQFKSNFPPQLTRRYEVYIELPPNEKPTYMRHITSSQLGALVKLKVRLLRLHGRSAAAGPGRAAANRRSGYWI